MRAFDKMMTGLSDAIPALLFHYGIMPPGVRRMEKDCLPLLKVWLEENGTDLLWQRWSLPYCPELSSDWMPMETPTVCFKVLVEDAQGRRRTGWTAISGRVSCTGEFFPRTVTACWGGPSKVQASKPKMHVVRATEKSLWDDWVDRG